jgi:hypothetical protein
MRERLERRVLGAIEFVDAVTGARIAGPLRVSAGRLKLVLNRSALYVVREAPGLEPHTFAFEKPPAEPALESLSFTLTVEDPVGRYLSRSALIKLPRKDAAQSDAKSVLRPVAVSLFPGAALPARGAWAVLRLRVQVADGQVGIANALVTATPQVAGATPVSAMTDAHGEALLAVPGISPVLPTAGGGAPPGPPGPPQPVLTREFGAALRIVLDRDVVRREDAPRPWPAPNPDEIERRRAAAEPRVLTVNPPAVQLTAGSSRRKVVDVALP